MQVKFGGGNDGCNGVGPLVKVEGRMNSKEYIRILSGKSLPYKYLITGLKFHIHGRECSMPSSTSSHLWMSAKNVPKNGDMATERIITAHLRSNPDKTTR